MHTIINTLFLFVHQLMTNILQNFIADSECYNMDARTYIPIPDAAMGDIYSRVNMFVNEIGGNVNVGIDDDCRLWLKSTQDNIILERLFKIVDNFVYTCRIEMLCILDDVQRKGILNIETTKRTSVEMIGDKLITTYEINETHYHNIPTFDVKYCNIVEKDITTKTVDENDEMIEQTIITRLGFEIEDIDEFWHELRTLYNDECALSCARARPHDRTTAPKINTKIFDDECKPFEYYVGISLKQAMLNFAIDWYSSIDKLLPYPFIQYPCKWI